MPTELRRLARLAIAATMILTLLGPALDAAAATDLYPGAPAVIDSLSAPFASIKSDPDPAAPELVQIDNGIPAQIVAGPLPGVDGLLWYQIDVAGLSGYIAEADLGWGIAEATEPAPVVTQAPLVVTGTGVVISPDGTEIACRAETRDDALTLFTYASGSTVDLAGPPAGGWQPVICAAQHGYLPASLVFDPANMPPPATEEIPDLSVVTDGDTEIVPDIAESAIAPEATSTPEIIEATETSDIVVTVTETTEIPVVDEAVEIPNTGTSTVEPTEESASEPSAPAVSPEAVIEITSTPEIAGTPAAEPSESSTPIPTETVTDAPSQTESSATTTVEVTSTPAEIDNAEVTTTPAETETAEAIEATEIAAQTTIDGDQAVRPAALASAAAVYDTGPGGLRCRVSPSLEARVLMVLPPGSLVTLTGYARDGWQPVICGGSSGFAAARYLQPTDGGSIEEAPAGQSGTVTGSSVIVQNTGGAGLRCRSGGNLDASIITVLPEGTTVSARGAAVGNWQPVTCVGVAGWVYTDFIGPASGNGSTVNNTGGSSSSTIGSAVVANTEGVGVRFRASASYDGAVIAVLMEGTSVTLREGSAGNWTAVTYDGRNGFIYADYLATARNPSNPGSNSGVGSTMLAAGSNAKVTDALNFRSGPSYSAGVVGIAAAGTVVRVTGASSSGFYPVQWAESTGYMHGDYLVYTTESLSTGGPNGGIGGNTGGGPGAGNGAGSPTGQAMVDYAMRYLGFPYVWATHGPNSFDCSGFTYWVVLNVTGRNIGAGTWTQWETGAPVQYGNLQPGDLVFFQNTYTIGLSHVGMYIGNDQFIHAENENTGVRISSLTSTYYSTRYLGARRMA